MKKIVIILSLATLISIFSLIEVSGKPALNEENRNLCESEPDKAECIREVEEAKGNLDNGEQQGDSLVNCDIINPETNQMSQMEGTNKRGTLWKNT